MRLLGNASDTATQRQVGDISLSNVGIRLTVPVAVAVNLQIALSSYSTSVILAFSTGGVVIQQRPGPWGLAVQPATT